MSTHLLTKIYFCNIIKHPVENQERKACFHLITRALNHLGTLNGGKPENIEYRAWSSATLGKKNDTQNSPRKRERLLRRLAVSADDVFMTEVIFGHTVIHGKTEKVSANQDKR